jgi:ppGpp synthetase/RelA/SpoT-type nucleotidyltranferase
MRVTQMNDVFGCRIVGPNEIIDAVFNRINDSMNVIDIDDYRESPRASGYRALHVVVLHEGCRIEIQLRNQLQHDWATLIEEVSSHSDKPFLKDGVGPPELVGLLAKVSEAVHQGTMSEADFVEFREDLRGATEKSDES